MQYFKKALSHFIILIMLALGAIKPHMNECTTVMLPETMFRTKNSELQSISSVKIDKCLCIHAYKNKENNLISHEKIFYFHLACKDSVKDKRLKKNEVISEYNINKYKGKFGSVIKKLVSLENDEKITNYKMLLGIKYIRYANNHVFPFSLSINRYYDMEWHRNYFSLKLNEFHDFLTPYISISNIDNSSKENLNQLIEEKKYHNIWRISIIHQLMANLRELHEHGLIHMDIRPRAYYLKNKFEAALFDVFSIEKLSPYRNFIIQTKYIKNDKGIFTMKDIKPFKRYQEYYDKKLYGEVEKLWREHIAVKYTRAANVRAFAFLILEILDPYWSQTMMRIMKGEHYSSFYIYCTRITTNKILPCVIFRELLEKMLSVPLNSDETIADYHDEFLTKVESLFAKGFNAVSPQLNDKNLKKDLDIKYSDIEDITEELKSNYEAYLEERMEAKWKSCKINPIHELGNYHSMSFLIALVDQNPKSSFDKRYYNFLKKEIYNADSQLAWNQKLYSFIYYHDIKSMKRFDHDYYETLVTKYKAAICMNKFLKEELVLFKYVLANKQKTVELLLKKFSKEYEKESGPILKVWKIALDNYKEIYRKAGIGASRCDIFI